MDLVPTVKIISTSQRLIQAPKKDGIATELSWNNSSTTHYTLQKFTPNYRLEQVGVVVTASLKHKVMHYNPTNRSKDPKAPQMFGKILIIDSIWDSMD
jgi:hypothetical protein